MKPFVKWVGGKHNTKLINELYKEYNKKTVQVKRTINSDASKRTGEEIIITNYPVDAATTSTFCLGRIQR